jgi:DtxR family Mn-dependent transcriptional regulator
VNDLIDTTEMYLRTLYELEEEDIVPLRARIAERLAQSGPTVSQTVARMERDGLLELSGDRHLELTAEGRHRAVAVMRKHRLAERLLMDVIGLDWREVHIEACRWEHVMSEQVERRLVLLLGNPHTSPYGNPIPGLTELGLPDDGRGDTDYAAGDTVTQEGHGPIDPDRRPRAAATADAVSTVTADTVTADTVTADEAGRRGGNYQVLRIIEVVQNQPDAMALLHRAGARPGTVVTLAGDDESTTITGRDAVVDVASSVAVGIRVRPA